MSGNENPVRTALDALLSVRRARGEDGRARDHRRALGRYGEELALHHLRARGFTLLTRNYRTRRGEIDLIAFDGWTLIFVEVKTQQVARAGRGMSVRPLEWLSSRQLGRIRPVAQAYLYDERYTCPELRRIRFDAIGVVVDMQGKLVALEHIEGNE